MIWYLTWIPIVVLFYVGYAWLTKQNNVHQDLKWFLLLYLYGGLIQPWVFVSRTSKNLVLDCFIYDFFIMASYIAAIIIIENKPMTVQQIIGIVLCVVGILMVR